MRYEILNGKAEDDLKLIEDDSIDFILTDPPFGVGFKNDFYDDSIEYVDENIETWFNEWYRILKEDSYLFIFVGVKTIHHWINQGIKSSFTFKNIVAARSFNNGSITPKNNFGFQFQPILVFSKGSGKPFNQVDFIPTSKGWFKDKRNKNPKPYTYSYPNFIKPEWAFASAKRASKNLHPNEKNVSLLEFFIKLATNENETVLDSFAGSFSTGIAALNTNRKFIGIEKDNGYFTKGQHRLKEREES